MSDAVMRQRSSSPPPATGGLWDSLLIRGLTICVYLSLNISLNMLNKWTLSLYGFKFPLFMSLAHMLFSFCALLPIMATRSFRELHIPTLQKQWPGITAIGAFFAVNVSFHAALHGGIDSRDTCRKGNLKSV